MPRKRTAKDPLTYKPAIDKHARDKEKLDKEKQKGNITDHTELFALKRDGQGQDEDDIQDFWVPPSPTKDIPDELLNQESHLPQGAILTDSQFPDIDEIEADLGTKVDYRLPPREKRKRVGVAVSVSDDPEISQYGDTADDPAFNFKPLPFESLMKSVTKWWVMKGTDYEIFPVQKKINHIFIYLCK